MPFYKMLTQIGDGGSVLLAGHVYHLDEKYAAALNAEKDGHALIPFVPGDEGKEEKQEHLEKHGDGVDTPQTAALRGDAWRSKGEKRGRLAAGS